MTKDGKPELLIPANNLEVFKTAVIYGADAVYIGGEAFSLRAKARNFTIEEMKEAVSFAHERGVLVYVTANILAHNDDIEEAYDYFRQMNEVKPDAFIISDPGLFSIAKEVCPDIDIHLSTQANNTNYQTYLFWWKQGATRVVSARELSLKEIKEIRDRIPKEMEIESFIHGAMCISYSGRCLLSNYFTGRDANQGACTHPCRWKYTVYDKDTGEHELNYYVEEKERPGEFLPVYENERGTYIFNSKDLCMVEHVPDMIEAGIDSFKIEGRMKTALYVATVARTYRKAIDDYYKSMDTYQRNIDWYKDEISKCTYRQFSTGFYYGKPTHENQIYDSNTYINEYIYLGTVLESRDDGDVLIQQKNKFCVGDTIEIMKPDGTNVSTKVIDMKDSEGRHVDSCPHSKQMIWLTLSEKPELYDILRVGSDAEYKVNGINAQMMPLHI